MGLTTVWFAIGALIMIFISFTPLPFVWQILIFLVLSSVLLIFTRPTALKLLKAGREKTNSESVIGRKALVIKKITKFDKGEVKCGGIVWTAKTEDESPLEKGTECTIVKIEGVTAIVAAIVNETK